MSQQYSMALTHQQAMRGGVDDIHGTGGVYSPTRFIRINPHHAPCRPTLLPDRYRFAVIPLRP